MSDLKVIDLEAARAKKNAPTFVADDKFTPTRDNPDISNSVVIKRTSNEMERMGREMYEDALESGNEELIGAAVEVLRRGLGNRRAAIVVENIKLAKKFKDKQKARSNLKLVDPNEP